MYLCSVIVTYGIHDVTAKTTSLEAEPWVWSCGAGENSKSLCRIYPDLTKPAC